MAHGLEEIEKVDFALDSFEFDSFSFGKRSNKTAFKWRD